MNNKFLIVILIGVIAVIAFAAAYSLGFIDSNEISNSADWQTKNLSGLKFKVPSKYENGAMLTGNIVNGVTTADTYQSQDLNIILNSANWTDEFDKNMNSSTATTVLLEIDGKEVTIFSENGESVAFFQSNDDKILMFWHGDEAKGEIKAIIKSIFDLN